MNNSHVSKRILVVEDDPSMTILLKSVISALNPGSEICYASSLEQAFAKILQFSDISDANPYELIVADIFLEGHGTGLDLWKVLCSTYPEIPFLVISSVSEQEVRQAIGEENQQQLIYLQKPFSAKAFAEKMQVIFDNQSSTQPQKIKVPSIKSNPELIHNQDEHEQMAHLLMLRMSSDWLSKQEWVNEPYGGQNPAQELLFHARISANKLWQDFFVTEGRQVTLNKEKIREHLMQMGELTPELKKFLEEKLDSIESVFQIH